MDYKKKRLFVLFAVFLSYWMTFFNRSLTTPTLPLLIEEWGMSMAGAGAVTSIMLLTYSLGHIPFGILADRYGRSRFLILGTASVGVVNVLLSFTTSFRSFLLLRGLVGLGAAANHAPLMALVNDWFPSRKRGLSMSALSIVTTLGPLTCLLWGKAIVAEYGAWQPVYYLTAIPAVLVVVAVLCFARDANAEERDKVRAEEGASLGGMVAPRGPQGHASWRAMLALFAHRDLWGLYAAWFFVIFEFFVLINFLPTLFVKIHGVELKSAIAMSTGWLWTGLFVSLIGGWLSDRLKHRKWFVVGLCTPAHLIIMAIPFLPLEMIFPALCLLGVFWFSTSGPFYAWSAEVGSGVNTALVATILGLCTLSGDIGGAVGSMLAGYLADLLGLKWMFWVAGGAGLLFSLTLALAVPETLARHRPGRTLGDEAQVGAAAS